jgi:anti-sigma-K factor RskA
VERLPRSQRSTRHSVSVTPQRESTSAMRRVVVFGAVIAAVVATTTVAISQRVSQPSVRSVDTDDSDYPSQEEVDADQRQQATSDLIAGLTATRTGQNIEFNLVPHNNSYTSPSSVVLTFRINRGTFEEPMPKNCTVTSVETIACNYVNAQGSPGLGGMQRATPITVTVRSTGPVTAILSVTHDYYGQSYEPNPADNTITVTA